MSTTKGATPPPSREINEAFIEFLATAARLLMWVGAILTAIGAAYLVYTCISFSGGNTPGNPATALGYVDVAGKFLFAGVAALGVASAYLFWGESILGGLLVIGAVVLYLSPMILSQAGVAAPVGSPGARPVSAALDALSTSGIILGAIAAFVVGIDVSIRAKTRLQQGSKADQLRYGKGVKEEVDRHNVFLGKCWQLPFCRKFVRERCPIYHSRRTCWKELTGCMCEEEVIRNAMENKPIPKDAVMAANYIPRNNKLTVGQKQERCKSCVIYNEHQKHKYKAFMPVILIFFGLIYALFHTQLIDGIGSIIATLDRLVGKATFRSADQAGHSVTHFSTFQEILLACLVVVLITYSLKLLEYLVFKLKI